MIALRERSWPSRFVTADMADLPRFAAWRHHGAREGFEVVFFAERPGGVRVAGNTSAVEDGEAFAVRYAIELDEAWHTRSAEITGQSSRGTRTVTLERDDAGAWRLDGRPASHLDGCLDVDLESSSLTNAFPVHRLGLRPGEEARAPAAYVRALGLGVERLEQRYRRVDDGTGRQRYEYAAPAFDFRCELSYDEAGLVLEYPGLATRVAG
jgi:hypothetical protein